MKELKHLLIEWSELEPNQCRHYKDEQSEDFDVLRMGTLQTIWAVNLGDISPSGLDTLQGAIQEGAAYHSLQFCLENAMDGLCYACIRSATRNWYGNASEAAIALLDAYVACLKDQAIAAQESES